MKLGLSAPSGLVPGLAIDVIGDRLNERGNVSARLIASTQRLGPLKLAAVGGAMARPLSDVAPVGGAALDLALGRAGLVVDALALPDGPKVGSALRFRVASVLGLSVGADWVPRDDGVRVSVGFAMLAAPPRQRRVSGAEGAKPVVPPPEPAREAPPEFLDDRPRFRLRIRPSPLDLQPGHRHEQGGAQPVSAGPAAPAPAVAGGVAAAGRRP
jgi:hypothetical protein